MHRRALLASIALVPAALAGCLADRTTDDPNPTDAPSVPCPTDEFDLSLDAIDGADEDAITVAVEALEREAIRESADDGASVNAVTRNFDRDDGSVRVDTVGEATYEMDDDVAHDPPVYAAYLLTEDGVYRAELESDPASEEPVADVAADRWIEQDC
ncbi:hypothetical protein [Halovivax gelatinilyticus]|uniref:hypothetical protein n=1 Tax=Halovivax gelatinilyticus TaxID=2961597 RepID=UPI0020CA3C5D|nr:hypothetical protein [Halovivax gelatinilyticus]